MRQLRNLLLLVKFILKKKYYFCLHKNNLVPLRAISNAKELFIKAIEPKYLPKIFHIKQVFNIFLIINLTTTPVPF